MCSSDSSPPEAQGEYVMYSPEIYRATAKCVLRERSMSTLCYRLNLVVSLGDVASGEHCDPVSSVDVTCHNVPRMPRVERAITLPVHQSHSKEGGRKARINLLCARAQ